MVSVVVLYVPISNVRGMTSISVGEWLCEICATVKDYLLSCLIMQVVNILVCPILLVLTGPASRPYLDLPTLTFVT